MTRRVGRSRGRLLSCWPVRRLSRGVHRLGSAAMSGFDAVALLALHRQVVQYDSLESYYTDWAAVITDHPGNVLKRADGTVVAAAGPPAAGVPQLTLAFLHPHTYPTGQPVAGTDYLAEVGSDYVTQARAMHARPGYAN